MGEAGFTKIDNNLLRAIALEKFNGTQYKIILMIWRNTTGFHRVSHNLSLSYLSECTNTRKNVIKRELDKLINCGVVVVEKEATFSTSRHLKFNTNVKEWNLNGLQSIDQDTVSQKGYTTVSQLEDSTVSQLGYQERNKEKLKENNYKDVFDYYITLELIKHRCYKPEMANAMKKAMKELNCDINHLKILLKRHSERVQATKDNDFPVKPRGITEFFGQKKYNSTQLICAEYDDDVYQATEGGKESPHKRLQVYK